MTHMLVIAIILTCLLSNHLILLMWSVLLLPLMLMSWPWGCLCLLAWIRLGLILGMCLLWIVMIWGLIGRFFISLLLGTPMVSNLITRLKLISSKIITTSYSKAVFIKPTFTKPWTNLLAAPHSCKIYSLSKKGLQWVLFSSIIPICIVWKISFSTVEKLICLILRNNRSILHINCWIAT